MRVRVSVIVPFVTYVSYNNLTVNIQTNIKLSTLTTMRLGGNASFVAHATTGDELRRAYKNAVRLKQPTYIIGGGSNLIAHDDGFDGVIILNEITGIDITEEDETSVIIKAAAGGSWDSLVDYSVKRNLSGIEAMSGIPGTVGAAPVQNIGAYGQELSDTFVSLEAYDIEDDTFVTMDASECEFSYRDSIFRNRATGKYAVTSITLKLYKRVMGPPFYQSLQAYFDAHGISSFTPQTVRDAVLEVRKSKLPDPKRFPSAGSFFKNAIIEKWQADPLKQQYPDMPSFDLGDGKVKIYSGWLIEQCELKGKTLHGMKIHEGNAVVLINESAKSYADLADAREEIRALIRDKFQISLDQEPLELSSPARQ